MKSKIARIASISIVTTSLLFGGETLSKEMKLVNYLQAKFSSNPNIRNLTISIVDVQPIPNSKEWEGVKINFTGKFRQGNRFFPFSDKQIFFTDGENFTENLTSLDGRDWKSLFAPKIEAKHYSPSHLLFGNSDAKHKIVVFSDPLCPYCKSRVPKMLEYVKKYPKTFAVYYYHLPLERIHPASIPLAKLMYIAQARGDREAVIKAYNTSINPRENDEKKILEAFNQATGLKYSETDLNSNLANQAIAKDRAVAKELEVRGTPTIYLDGKKVGGKFYEDIEKVD